MKKRKIIIISVLIIFILFILWTIWGNITVCTTKYNIYSDRLPYSFDDFRIAQISDLHNAEFGKNNSKLIKILKKEKPDIIVFTGDLVDSNHTDIDIAIDFVKTTTEIAPCYFVTGNHEYWLGEKYEELENKLMECQVNVLRDNVAYIEKNSEKIQLIGVDDPNFTVMEMSDVLKQFDMDKYNVLLSHRPELFDSYVGCNIDLVLTGHAHGGQFRLPFIGGLFAPNYGFFPKYDSGKFSKNNTTMIVSRGVGNSVIPVRINNRPEIVFVDLHRKVSS